MRQLRHIFLGRIGGHEYIPPPAIEAHKKNTLRVASEDTGLKVANENKTLSVLKTKGTRKLH